MQVAESGPTSAVPEGQVKVMLVPFTGIRPTEPSTLGTESLPRSVDNCNPQLAKKDTTTTLYHGMIIYVL